MANPQPDPFVKFSKELFDAILLSSMPGTHKEIVLAVIRRTYGNYGKKKDHISRSLLQTMTGRARSGVRRAVDELISEGVIVQVAPSTFSTAAVLALNKNYERWGKWSVGRATTLALGQELALGQDDKGGGHSGGTGEGHSGGTGEGHSGGPIEDNKTLEDNTTDGEEEEPKVVDPRDNGDGSKPPPKKPRKKPDLKPDNPAYWTGRYVDLFREAGREDPLPGELKIFGKHIKDMLSSKEDSPIEEGIFDGAVNMMLDQDKGPGVIRYLYRQERRDSIAELAKLRGGGTRNAR